MMKERKHADRIDGQSAGRRTPPIPRLTQPTPPLLIRTWFCRATAASRAAGGAMGEAALTMRATHSSREDAISLFVVWSLDVRVPG